MSDILYKMNRTAKTKRSLTILAVICAAFTVFILGNWVIDQINLATNGEPDFTTLSQGEIKNGLFVTGTITEAIGPYAEQYTRDSHGNESDASLNQFYYLVPVYSQNGDHIAYFVTFEARHHYNDRHDMAAIATSSGSGYHAKPLYLEHARMEIMGNDQKRILEKWATSPDFYEGGSFVDYCAANNMLGTADKEVILAKIITCNISREWHAGIELSNVLYPLVPGVFFALWILLIDAVQKKRKEKYAQEKKERIYQQSNSNDNTLRFYGNCLSVAKRRLDITRAGVYASAFLLTSGCSATSYPHGADPCARRYDGLSRRRIGSLCQPERPGGRPLRERWNIGRCLSIGFFVISWSTCSRMVAIRRSKSLRGSTCILLRCM